MSNHARPTLLEVPDGLEVVRIPVSIRLTRRVTSLDALGNVELALRQAKGGEEAKRFSAGT